MKNILSFTARFAVLITVIGSLGISPALAATSHFVKSNFSVKSIPDDGLFHIQTITVNDTNYSSQTYLSQIDTQAAWNETTGSSVTVAIIDTGIDGMHEDLAGRVVAGYNFLTSSDLAAGSSSDDNGHGTALAGIIAANQNNAIGIAGIDWRVKLMPLKVADSNGVATSTNVSSAIRYAADHGAKIINMSIGSSSDYSEVSSAVSYAASKGLIIVAAAGNHIGGTPDPVAYPAAYPDVIAVGSVDSNGALSSFSNTGSQLALVAPGENVYTLSPTNHNAYTTASGTSLAAPQVTAAASIILGRYPNANRDQVKSLLVQQTTKLSGMSGQNFTTEYGYGRLDIGKTVSLHSQFAGQNSYPTLTAGQSYQLQVNLLNTGLTTWYKTQVNLGTDRGQDRIPQFVREDTVNKNSSGWFSANRVQLSQATVAPGAIGTFNFYYSVPTGLSAGTYREFFRPVFDGFEWMENMGIYWDVTVTSLASSYQASYVSQNIHEATVKAGDSILLTAVLNNSGTSTWRQGVVNLGTDRGQDRIPRFIREDVKNGHSSGWYSANRVQMSDASVAPGANATFNFWYTVPSNLPAGTYREYFRPVADGITWMNDFGMYWDITVQ